jgi:hypothetical protein
LLAYFRLYVGSGTQYLGSGQNGTDLVVCIGGLSSTQGSKRTGLLATTQGVVPDCVGKQMQCPQFPSEECLHDLADVGGRQSSLRAILLARSITLSAKITLAPSLIAGGGVTSATLAELARSTWVSVPWLMHQRAHFLHQWYSLPDIGLDWSPFGSGAVVCQEFLDPLAEFFNRSFPRPQRLPEPLPSFLPRPELVFSVFLSGQSGLICPSLPQW